MEYSASLDYYWSSDTFFSDHTIGSLWNRQLKLSVASVLLLVFFSLPLSFRIPMSHEESCSVYLKSAPSMQTQIFNLFLFYKLIWVLSCGCISWTASYHHITASSCASLHLLLHHYAGLNASHQLPKRPS